MVGTRFPGWLTTSCIFVSMVCSLLGTTCAYVALIPSSLKDLSWNGQHSAPLTRKSSFTSALTLCGTKRSRTSLKFTAICVWRFRLLMWLSVRYLADPSFQLACTVMSLPVRETRVRIRVITCRRRDEGLGFVGLSHPEAGCTDCQFCHGPLVYRDGVRSFASCPVRLAAPSTSPPR